VVDRVASCDISKLETVADSIRSGNRSCVHQLNTEFCFVAESELDEF
jgi:hypothetical protein